MLRALSIRNIVLIEKLDVTFENGMTVLTGETGAGKSILLDALNLALGERAQSSLIRPSETQGSVTAEFEVSADSDVCRILDEAGLEFEERLVLRRILSRDGKSRAFVNDQPVSVSLLGELSTRLIEIHGQFDKILTPSTHIDLLDTFGAHQEELIHTKKAFQDLLLKRQQLIDAENLQSDGKKQIDFWRYAVEELTRLSPKKGEVEHLESERHYLVHRTKIVESLLMTAERFSDDSGLESQFAQAFRGVERVHSLAPEKFSSLYELFSRISDDLNAASKELSQVLTEDDDSVARLNQLEQRLFDLNEVARKHHVNVDDLENLLFTLKDNLSKVEGGDSALSELRREVEDAENRFTEQAKRLSMRRIESAERLDALVNAELPPLKLESAAFKTHNEQLPSLKWHERGWDKVEFMVRTNPGHPFAGLGKIASGGELSRFMLALKVIIAHQGYVSTLIFDEIDSGVSGGVASAIGERLARLGHHVQVFAITHSALVAAAANHHYRVVKSVEGDSVRTELCALNENEREKEVARLIGGDVLSDSAVQTAKALIKNRI